MILTQYRAQQQERALQQGQIWNEQRWVFCKADGTHLNPHHDVYEVFKGLLKEAGLPDIRFHDLRHIAATMHLGMMTNPKIVQEILGHSTISITMDAYSHVLPSMHKEAMENVNQWFLSLTAAHTPPESIPQDVKPDQKHRDDDDQEGGAVPIPA